MESTRIFALLLLAVHGLLAIWALVGFVEWFFVETPCPRVSNEHFPRDILFMQWTLILLAAIVFITGYLLKWPNTPTAMACIYASMAALCAIQTFGYMKGDLKFLAMGLEYLAYSGILMFLFRSNIFQPA